MTSELACITGTHSRVSGRAASLIVHIPLALLILLAAGSLCSCIVLPIPHNHVNGRAVTADPLTIKVGVTTQEDVLLRLGDPDAIWADERVFAYTWDHVTWAVVVVIVSYSGIFGAGGDLGASHEVLLVQFDESSHVRRVNRTSKPENVPWGEFLKNWAKGGAGAKP